MKPSIIISFLAALNTIHNYGMGKLPKFVFLKSGSVKLWIPDTLGCLYEVTMYQHPLGVKLVAESKFVFDIVKEFNQFHNNLRKA